MKIKLASATLVSSTLKVCLVCLFFTILFQLQIASAESNKNYHQLERKIQAQQYSQAYQQAQELRSSNEGDPRFDFLYGLSALQTGHYNEAVFALERVVANQPAVIRPRLELSRAYLKQHNDQAAIGELKNILSLQPNKATQQQVNTYIGQIKARNTFSRSAVTNSLLAFSMGYDDNINFGFGDEEIRFPVFGNIVLDPNSVQQKSAFAESKLQFNYRKANSKRFNHFATAALQHREYFKNNDFNITDLDFRTGLTYNNNENQYQIALRYRPVWLGGEGYANTLGIDTTVRRSLGLGALMSVSLTLEDFNHKIESLRNRKRIVVSGKIDKKTDQFLHQINAYIGTENPNNDNSNSDPFSRDLKGIGYRLIRPWNAQHKSYLKLDYQSYDHQAPYPVYTDAREDERYSLWLGHELKVDKNLDLIFSAKHMSNKSNLELFDIDRNEVKIGVRYEWK